MDRSLVLLAVLISCSLAQPCNFAVKSPTISGYLNTKPVWYGRPLELTTCYLNTPFNKTVLDQTVAVLKAAMEMYTFRDVVSQSGPPYNIQIDPLVEISKISTATSDWEMHVAISKAFDKAKDNHLRYTLPGGYGYHYVVLPFHLTSDYVSGKQVFKVAEGQLGSDFDLATSQSTSQHYGKTVTHINSIPIRTFLDNFGNRLPFKDDGIKINAVLSVSTDFGFFSVQPMRYYPPVDNYTWTFEDGSTANLANLAISEVSTTTVAAFQALNAFGAPGVSTTKNTLAYNFSSDDLVFQYATTNKEMSYWNYKQGNAIVCWIRNFAATETEVQNFAANMLNYANNNNVKNLILDLSGNPGGTVGYAFQFAAFLVREWDRGQLSGTTNMYQTFDLLNTPFMDRMVDAGTGKGACRAPAPCGTDEYCSVSGECLKCGGTPCSALVRPAQFRNPVDNTVYTDANFYMKKTIYTRGNGRSSNYSQPVFYSFQTDVSLRSNPATPQFWFDKIIAVTSGLCGSACAQFLHQLRYNDKIRVISYGGIAGADMDVLSYPGGAVTSWNALGIYPHVPKLPTNAFLQVNYMQMYDSCQAPGQGLLPREFRRIPADANLKYWKSLNSDMYSARPGGIDAQTGLYDLVYPYFGQMPSGLASAQLVARNSLLPDYCSRPTPNPIVFSVDCIGSWVPVAGSQCTLPCGGGTQKQTYVVKIPGLSGVGSPCPVNNGTIQDRPCNDGACVNCSGTWLPNGKCNVDCGEGQRSIVYNITQQAGPNGVACDYISGQVETIPCIGTGVNCDNSIPAPSGSRYPVIPYFHCFEYGAVIYLGYENRGPTPVTIPVQMGVKNFLTPNGSSSLKTYFKPGSHRFAMAIVVPDGTQPYTFTIDGTVNFDIFSSLQVCPDTLQVLLTDLPAPLNTADAETIRSCFVQSVPTTDFSVTISVQTFAGNPRAIFTIKSDPQGDSAARIVNAVYLVSDTLIKKIQDCAPNVNIAGSSLQLPVPTFGSNPGFVTNDQAAPPSSPTTIIIIAAAVGGVLLLIAILVVVIVMKKKKDAAKEDTIYRRM